MADILDMQDNTPETPADEKASNLSTFRWCYNSYISLSLCFVK